MSARRRRWNGRDVHGVFLLDKPTGISSNDALQRVKKIFFAAKAGHTGALDPLATGMLPLCFGEATKFSQFLLDSDKRYLVTAKLGERTDTSDSDGEIVQTRAVNVSDAELLIALDTFRGDTEQVPSMFSALKHEGKPLYWYARQGIFIDRPSRPISVFELKLLSYENDEVNLEIHVSKGTYIRTIVDDLGELLGCGAHVTMLRRIGVSAYPADRMITFEKLEEMVEQAKAEGIEPKDVLDPLLLPLDSAVSHLPEANMSDETGGFVLHGQPVVIPNTPESGLVRMTVGDERTFIGVGSIDDQGRVAPKRIVNYETQAREPK
ncbi:MAG: tRNA pseudouridine(55) synthase TruB [Moritella sp.]|uniref:tRNA pseudouridine(55) synthase TruB n=1 Tax=unclassified Moritella TaxID=2637987 RepID=UPI0001568720|nr:MULTISPECIES: tRNA pseudouridine(55) synthase TruB [unclassified Moritella]EDM67543.1 tRNA pseudouridine synthase B [Moritella sp. PE36]MBL1417691.1 tRNA pseudouridine(55) synthase TruB [Moritella sp.]PHR88291.1 MAG: tRNA pseudouridine(55) synthase TruB [Moritella sp.]